MGFDGLVLAFSLLVGQKGPTATLLSVARTRESKYKAGASRLFTMKQSPESVAGEEGTKRLAALIRTWCDLKI